MKISTYAYDCKIKSVTITKLRKQKWGDKIT